MSVRQRGVLRCGAVLARPPLTTVETASLESTSGQLAGVAQRDALAPVVHATRPPAIGCANRDRKSSRTSSATSIRNGFNRSQCRRDTTSDAGTNSSRIGLEKLLSGAPSKAPLRRRDTQESTPTAPRTRHRCRPVLSQLLRYSELAVSDVQPVSAGTFNSLVLRDGDEMRWRLVREPLAGLGLDGRAVGPGVRSPCCRP